MAEYGRSSIAARVAQQAMQNQNQIVPGGEAPDMSQATKFSSGGGGILSRLGIGGGGTDHGAAKEAVTKGGDYQMEERNFTVTDKETGEVFDMGTAATVNNISAEQNELIGQHSNHQMMSHGELKGAGQVAIIDSSGQALNEVTREMEITLADGSTKKVNVTSYSNADEFVSDPEKKKQMVLRQVRNNLTEIYGDDTDTIEKYVRAFSEGLDGKQTNKALQKTLNNIQIRSLDQDKFQQLMRSNPQKSSLAKEMAKRKPKTATVKHEEVYEKKGTSSGVSYSDIANKSFSLKGMTTPINSTTRFSDTSALGRTTEKFKAGAIKSMEDSGLAFTGTGYAKFEGLKLAATTGKEGSLSGVDAGRGNGTYGTLMKYAVANDMIDNHADTDTTIEGWDKSASYNKKVEFLVENGIIENPGRMQFGTLNKETGVYENAKEEELEFKASLVAYYDQTVAPQLKQIATAYTKEFGVGYKNQMLNMYKADKELASELYSKRTKLKSVNDISTGNAGAIGLNTRLDDLNKNKNFLGDSTSIKGEFGIEYGGFTFDSVMSDINDMHRYADKADYIQNLMDNNVVTAEAGEALNDMARYQEVNSRGLSEEIDALESRLGLGEASNQIAKVNKEIKSGGMSFVPVGPMNQHHLSGIQYSKEAGGFVTGGRRTIGKMGFGIAADIEAQDKIAVNRANFTTKLNSNYSNLINQDGLNLSKEQYFGILRKKFAADYTEDNNFGLGEEEYKSMQDLFNNSTDEELVSYSLNIDKATRIPSS